MTFFDSAGAGRTGAYIAIDYLTQQLQEEAKVDVMKLILKMRESRKDMVQNAVGIWLGKSQQAYPLPFNNGKSKT